jgi:predicted phosphodiesterase
MNNDLDVIIKKYPREQDILRVYAIGDVHVGSREFNEAAIKKKIDIIKNDPYAALCICGDLGDYGLKNSKTNVYQATMSPREQQKYIHKLFLPVVDKIAAVVPGNHEERITKEVGTCPLYDLCVLWDIPEVYRENVAITKYMFGNRNKRQQHIFIGVTTHGASRAKHKKFIAGFDGIDFAISGHTHVPEYSPHGKIRVDRNHGNATHVQYKEIVVDADLSPGGYGLKKEYEIPTTPELQYLELSIYRSSEPGDPRVRAMDYHSITI